MSEKLFTSYTCGACKAVAGLAETMFNLSRRDTTDGKILVLCRRDAMIAKGKGLEIFRLSDTLRRDAKRETERRASEIFWAAFNGRKQTEEARRRPHVRVT